MGPTRSSYLSLALGYCFVAGLDEIFASAIAVVHPRHCLTRRDVALYRGGAAIDLVAVPPGY